MSAKPNVRLEAAIFFAAACLVMVLAANFRVMLQDLSGLLHLNGAIWTGASLRVVMVGVVIAAVAYGGAIVILVPAYDFLIQILQRFEERSENKADAAPDGKRKQTKREKNRQRARRR